MILRLVVLVQYRCVKDRWTDGQTDGHTHDDRIYCASIASRGKNATNRLRSVKSSGSSLKVKSTEPTARNRANFIVAWWRSAFQFDFHLSKPLTVRTKRRQIRNNKIYH